MRRSGKLTLGNLLGIGTLFVMFAFLMPVFSDIVANTISQTEPFLSALILLIPIVIIGIPVMLIFTSQVRRRRQPRRRRRGRR